MSCFFFPAAVTQNENVGMTDNDNVTDRANLFSSQGQIGLVGETVGWSQTGFGFVTCIIL